MTPYFTDGERTLWHADCLDVLPGLEADSVSLALTDPPYSIAFMSKSWDRALPDPRIWSEVLRVLKPGAFLFAFMTPRQDCHARFLIQLEDAGFDTSYYPIQWLYLSGFPKGHDVSAAIDRAAGAEREVVGHYVSPQFAEKGYKYDATGARDRHKDVRDRNVPIGNCDWEGRTQTAPATPLAARWDGWKAGRQVLKPAHEVIVVAQKPLSEKTFVKQVLATGTGALNTKGAAVPFPNGVPESDGGGWGWPNVKCEPGFKGQGGYNSEYRTEANPAGRHPANVVSTGGALGERSKYFSADAWMKQHFPNWWATQPVTWTEESATVYCPKAQKAEKERGLDGMPRRIKPVCTGETRPSRAGGKSDWSETGKQPVTTNVHATVKPLALLCWLATLGCPVGGTVLDPFAGSGSSGVASKMLGLRWLGMEMQQTEDEPYCEIAKRRIMAAEYVEPEAKQLTLEEVAG